MACGCPVMSSGCGSLKEVVGDAALVIDPEDVPGMARQLSAMADDVFLRKQLRNAGLKRAQHFNWQKSAERTLEAYSAVGNR